MLEGYAEYYSAELSQKVRRGMNETRMKGNYTGGHLLYGYRKEGKKVVARMNSRRMLFALSLRNTPSASMSKTSSQSLTAEAYVITENPSDEAPSIISSKMKSTPASTVFRGKNMISFRRSSRPTSLKKCAPRSGKTNTANAAYK